MAAYTDFDDMDLATAERAAWQRGDFALAAILAGADDLRATRAVELEETRDERDAAVERADAAEATLAELRIRAEAGIDDITRLLDAASCVSSRAEIETALQTLYDDLMGA